ncbi:hypothetical protein COE15_00340 [Bacillus cereus]|nr:hypothetical protein CN288_12805 [Bacillus sp. AFS023182]PGY05734.1 hypothetical protein COE15_00340 [Bacillus cereus]
MIISILGRNSNFQLSDFIEKNLKVREREGTERSFSFYLYCYLRTVRLPPQNSAKAKKVGGRSTVRKSPIGEG